VISAAELAAALGRPEPTEQQRAVIEAPLSPALVVAGAGSGKTETMANRVIWLLANGRVTAGEVLGLTFTRKAAGELAERIADRIAGLERAGLLPAEADPLESATVSTYNAFASGIFQENALLVGREPEPEVLSDSAAWLLARRVVVESRDERLAGLGRSIDQLADAVLELSRELGENVADGDAVVEFAARFAYLAELPFTDGRAKSEPYREVVKAVEGVSALPVLVRLAQRFAEEKRRRGVVEFSDQVGSALTICERLPAVVGSYRERYRVVLLDEYQDTSVVQTRLLARLFADHPVMAVGDPHQSIYGWRGASAANLSRFSTDFGIAAPALGYSLATSWRNATAVLDAANVLVAPLRAASAIEVERLAPRPGAPRGTIETSFTETVEAEAGAVAAWLEGELAVSGDDGPRTAAVLFRSRRHMALFAAALEDRGIPHHVLGLGGLLSAPEIVDLVSTLRVIHDPTAGSELIRLLAGARHSIGVRDLQRLSDLAGWLHSRDWSQHRLSEEVRERMRDSVAAEDSRSLVDALDFLVDAPEGHSQLAGFSEDGLQRLRDAGRQLSYFRSRAGLELPDLVSLVEQELLLDIELVANERNRSGLANLHAFHDELEGFLAVDELGTLGSFLRWLRRAERNDTMGPRSEAAEPGAVQLLTIHGAKGLEWDIVAVPRLVADELPARSREGTGWVRFGKLPYEFRGDREELPSLEWRGLPSQQRFAAGLKAFAEALAARHQDEERRLIYVAVTRARDSLLLAGSFWSGGVTGTRPPSPFLGELAERGIVPEPPGASEHAENPLGAEELTEEWPLDPLGSRRGAVERAAAAVLAADPGGDAGAWQRDLELLLAERERSLRSAELVPLPSRVAASRFKDFVTDPAAVAAALRRPMPQQPYRATRLGTLFHGWVEQRSGGTGRSDLIDAAAFELDDDPAERPADAAELTRLQQIFERSEFASLRPEEVELEIHLVLDGQVFVCKLDAVYRVDGGYRIVDWKTGAGPRDERELRLRQLQLALYRLAFARWKGIDPRSVDAVFFYVSDDRVIRPERIDDEQQIIALWRGVTGRTVRP